MESKPVIFRLTNLDLLSTTVGIAPGLSHKIIVTVFVREVEGKLGGPPSMVQAMLNGLLSTPIESLQLIWGDAALELAARSKTGRHKQSFLRGTLLQREILILMLVRCKAPLSHTVLELVCMLTNCILPPQERFIYRSKVQYRN